MWPEYREILHDRALIGVFLLINPHFGKVESIEVM